MMKFWIKGAITSGLLIMAAPAMAQDGLADEAVTLNKTDSAQVALNHLQRPDESQRPYTLPVDLKDGLVVGDLNQSVSDRSGIDELRARIGRGEYGYIDSLLISHKGRLLVEDYWGEGAIDQPHFQFSITKCS